MDGQNRSRVPPGTAVAVVQKEDQPTGQLTWGTVDEILTNSAHHHRGIKVRLRDGVVGRVQRIGREPPAATGGAAAAAPPAPQKTMDEWMGTGGVKPTAHAEQVSAVHTVCPCIYIACHKHTEYWREGAELCALPQARRSCCSSLFWPDSGRAAPQ
jgi:uncharacterized repeat protein (TIGR03833 family)